MSEYDEIARKLFDKPGFHKHDIGPAMGNSNTAIIKFEGRYPEDRLKTRNLVSDMEIRVLKGECTLYLLEGSEMGGNGKVGFFYEGDLIFVPKMFFYVWETPRVVLLNEAHPPWTKEQQDIRPMTDQDQQVLRSLQVKGK